MNQQIVESKSDKLSKLPWYREFWPWFIVLLTLLVLFASTGTIIIAQKQNERIPMDYQKQGLTITKGRLAESGSASDDSTDPQKARHSVSYQIVSGAE